MSRKRPTPQADASPEPPIQDAVQRALASMGWTLPQDEPAVAEAEHELDEQTLELPAELANPAQAWDRAESSSDPVEVALRLPLAQASDIDATLARAAREGGRISAKVEKAMRRDRAAAEAQADQQAEADDGDSHGEDVR